MKHFAATLIIMTIAAVGHVAFGAAQSRTAHQLDETYTIDVPAQIADYVQKGVDIEVDERTKRVLETSTVLMRNYASSSGWPVQLTVVYAGTTRRSLHFPEVCLVGAGWEIRKQDMTAIGFEFVARRLVLVRGNQQQAVLYWFKTGDHLTGNYFVNAWEWAKNQITFGSRTSAMIKLTTPISSPGEEMSFEMLNDFAMKFVPILRQNVS